MLSVARSALKTTLENLDDQRPSLSIEGQAFHKVDIKRGDAITIFEPFMLSPVGPRF
ncbi:MAG: hypothetical protein OXC62_01545 [Aestuariivita sp.]|nr:hypothetical protein [Aestuariivita sp.]